MKAWPLLALGVLFAILVGLAVWRAEPVYLSFLSGRAEAHSVAERRALLAPAIEIVTPEEGAGPFPTVLQFHGCAGPRAPFQRQWAETIASAGYAAVIVDSTGPRGYSRQEALDVVCGGKALLGQERAGDVLAAYEIARADPRLDASRLVLAGWSHGAWSVMDFLTMDMERRRPAGLTGGDLPVPTIAGAILFYPHCGAGAWSKWRAWSQTPPVLTMLGDADTIVNAQECISYFEKKKQHDPNVELVVYPNAEHVFDDAFLEPEWIHWYDADAHADAQIRVARFLTELKG